MVTKIKTPAKNVKKTSKVTLKKQKPTKTSVKDTSFCKHKLIGPDGFLWIDGNGKITRENGSLIAPKPNAFSLLQITDCPGSTEICRESCYVHNIQEQAPKIHELYNHNSQKIREILTSKNNDSWSDVMSKWIEANCQGGFRWHVSGDIFSIEYAHWIAKVCSKTTVRHWIYTRSYEFLEPLVEVQNLTVNLSCDKDNYEQATIYAKKFGLRKCFMTKDGKVPEDLPDGSVIFPDYSLRGGNELGQQWFTNLTAQYKSFVCPVDYHGKSEERRCGPCNRCL